MDAPLNEEVEKYRIGIGSVAYQEASWETGTTNIELSAAQIAQFAGSDIWVRQVGRDGQSDPLLLAKLP